MTTRKKIVYLFLIAFVVMQFIRPTRNTSDVMASSDIRNHSGVPAYVENILKT